MNRREYLQQFFISANTAQDRHDFDFEKFIDEYLIRNPDVVKEKCNLQNVTSRLYKWAVIENIVTILAVVGLFAWTTSGWCFLLLLNINSIKSNFKK